MSGEPELRRAGDRPDLDSRLAFERTFLAHERTQLAWVRTSLTLISFGFAIAKFYDFVRRTEPDRAPLLGPRAVGALMITLGLVSLTLADWQRVRAMRTMRARCPDLPLSLAPFLSALLALLGILALVAAVLQL